MSNTSASGGYLVPYGTPPIEDAALDDVLTSLVAGVTGLNPSFVRPRWQPTPPPVPKASTNWAAVGVTRSIPDANAYIRHHGDGNGWDEMQRHDTLEVTVSFYGPSARGYAKRCRDGCSIPQNREALFLAGFGFVSAETETRAPDFVNEAWIDRIDQILVFRHEIRRNYPVLNLLSAVGTIETEGRSQPFDTANVED